MNTDTTANELWDPNADFSISGGGLYPWLADLDINNLINMSDNEAEKAKERYENNR
jgi:hypothetical protein